MCLEQKNKEHSNENNKSLCIINNHGKAKKTKDLCITYSVINASATEIFPVENSFNTHRSDRLFTYIKIGRYLKGTLDLHRPGKNRTAC